MSAQRNEQVTTSFEAERSVPQGLLRVIEGGLNLGEMPTPIAETVRPTADRMPWDCPAPKFENGGSHLGRDIGFVPVQYL